MNLVCVLTTIQEPTESVLSLVRSLESHGGRLLAIGDQKGPARFDVPAAAPGLVRFLGLDDQRRLPFALAPILPTKHYARKNLGYLQAIADGAECIYETDDDNAPTPQWRPRTPHATVRTATRRPWLNVYRLFCDELIWPRGFPLELVRDPQTWRHDATAPLQTTVSPVHQGLADLAPDVDAAWRLLLDREFHFDKRPGVLVPPGTWCPFNSQNTWWWPQAYALLYLPSTCTFRMTDIWRSFIAQRCLWELGHGVVFHEPDVVQLRNMHNLVRDFADEVPGYLRNGELVRVLEDLRLESAAEMIGANLLRCYEALTANGFFTDAELPLVRAWLDDLARLGRTVGIGGSGRRAGDGATRA